MKLDLNNKVALVTGSSRGIGKAIAETLHIEGCRVVLNGRQAESLGHAVAALPGAIGFVADVSTVEGARRLVDEVLGGLGQLDILVCNVGSGRSVPPGRESAQEWQRVFALNLWSATNMVEAAQEALVASCGAVVCVSSICGLEVIPNAPVTYSVAKAALNAYIRGIARPLGAQGVRINAIAPGNILFDDSVWDRKLKEDAAGVQAMLERDVALVRLGTPVDVANLAAFLVSPQAGFATGEVWALDGGQVRG
ncbi:MAG: SDR family oxidoreductase [Gammaproteobacteria bacterium]|nr:SDR family oxidoreductase [Gammaproteobacteria bacterium]MBU0788304.1 SDR family oxidoreductase [Gammaproteobacteria bacterium]MBU0815199.1 SDR family oxidoreductase [Gammaproteobacteria bacterium]MBU1785693.1 SDR family oxidoreductase [Gammaproteobacteria bacterium]